MSRIYEAMFLIDNDTVRASWQQAKASVAGLIEKHGGKVRTSRRWAERRLSYPIRRRNRATYLLSYLELPQEHIPGLHRDLEINDMVLRHLFMRAEEVPAEEVELSEAESANDFVVPEPPADDAIDEPEPEPEAKAPAAEASEAKPEGEAEAEEPPAAAADAPADVPADAPAEVPAEVPAEAPAESPAEAAPAAEPTASEETSTTEEPEKTEG
jgi:ribosomal protein S6